MNLQQLKTNFLRFITYGLANAVTTNLESNIKNLNYLRKKKIHFLPNPVKIPKNIKRSKKENFILSVGRLHLQKNYFQLLRAFKEFSKHFPDWKYIIVGKGKLEKKIKNLINSLELQDRVILKGFTDPQPYYKKAAFVLFGSHYEGMPNVILESMANNVPVLTSNFEGIEKLIKNNKNGLVFTLNSDKDLIKKMIFMANRDNSRFISNAYKDVSKFNLKKITEDWVKLINNI